MSATTHKTSETKECPQCAEIIKAEAKVCRFCGARFTVTVMGYCTRCHLEVEVDEAGRCPRCGGEAVDRHVESTLITEEAPRAAPVEGGQVEPPGPADRYLQSGEQVVYRTRLHTSMLWGAGVEFLAALVLAGIGLWVGPMLSDARFWIVIGPLTLLALIAGVAIVAQYFASEVTLTDRRVLATVLWGLRVNVPLADISGVQTAGRGRSSGALTIVKRNGQKAYVGPIPDPEDLQVMIAERAGVEISEPSARTGRRVVGAAVSLMMLAIALTACYAAFYHDGPPIPGVDQFFRNVQYDIESKPVPLAREGFYLWNITNQNDFAWPNANIGYGDTYAFPLGRVEPGETKTFWNVQLFNVNTEGTESVPMLEGARVEIKLYVDFAEESSWAARLKKLLGLSIERYSLGEWHR